MNWDQVLARELEPVPFIPNPEKYKVYLNDSVIDEKHKEDAGF